MLSFVAASGDARFQISPSGMIRLLSICLNWDGKKSASPGSAGNGRATELCRLARDEPGLAAWLVDQTLAEAGTAARFSMRMPECPAEPFAWTSIESQVAEWVCEDRFLQCLTASLDELKLSVSECRDWIRDDRLLRERLHRRLAQVAGGVVDALPVLRHQANAFFWWACYFGVTVWSDSEGRLHRGAWHSEPEEGAIDEAEVVLPECSDFESGLVRLARLALEQADREASLRAQFSSELEREKLAAMKELAYGASHEINNPLANISSRAQILLRDETDPGRRKALAAINRQAFRAHEMIADMMLFAKPPSLQLESTAWDDWIDQLTCALADEVGDLTLVVEHEDAFDLELMIDPIQLEAAVRAIFKNAVEVSGERGEIRVRTQLLRLRSGAIHSLVIEVQDSGPGMTDRVRRHLFDPFFSGREAGRGLGFGLSKAWRIAELHGGQVLVDSQPGSTSVSLVVPCESTQTAEPTQAAPN